NLLTAASIPRAPPITRLVVSNLPVNFIVIFSYLFGVSKPNLSTPSHEFPACLRGSRAHTSCAWQADRCTRQLILESVRVRALRVAWPQCRDDSDSCRSAPPYQMVLSSFPPH